ncbi:SRPBCC family protein [Sphingomonas aerophila]|jgi:uncharacterized protein YndB with AHSA1/START domain|uniref:Uncharacterized protein YndB with AHSA1/START domain n=1 Tax=Sphingomonas aerophila TaxID=1344948 RepID=A0A7W9BD63_9SPHN|nr:SRPBCC family protein [Sphingomonas aerophila]MBB5715020.1 uncharacterized protein YndB with AHSA1/START domain [Sphingomonas aerophila]
MTDTPHELTISRLMRAPRAAVWQAFTDHQADWWCPKPWTAEIHVRELRPGGRAEMTMRGPNGEVFPNNGVYLDVVPAERVVFTDAFTADWQPAGPFMVGIMEFADEDGGTRYTGRARHWTPEAAEKHRAMGFEQGWGKVAEQWEEVARRIAGA